MPTPNDVQNQINAVPWTNGRGLVTGATMFGLLTAIVGLFAYYAPLANPVFTGTVTMATPLAATSGGTGANTPAGARSGLNVGNFATPQDYGCVENGTVDCAAATTTAAAITGNNGHLVNVYLRAGSYLWNSPVNLSDGQTLYGDGRSTHILITNTFSPTAVGVITLDGREDASPTVRDMGFYETQPNSYTATLSNASISGTSLTGTIVSGTPANGNVIDVGAPANGTTTLSNVAIAGSSLTATVSLSQTVASTSMSIGIGRSNFTTLAAGCSVAATGNGCIYPPVIKSVSSNRFKLNNLSFYQVWDGIDASANGAGFFISNIEMGALDKGFISDTGLDFCHLSHYHFWDFGMSNNIHYGVFNDGQTYAAVFDRCDGIDVQDFDTYRGKVLVGSSFTFGQFNGVYLDSDGATLEIDGAQRIQFNNFSTSGVAYNTGLAQVYMTGGFATFTNITMSPSSGLAFKETGGKLIVSTGGIVASSPGTQIINQSGGYAAFSNLQFAMANNTWTTPLIQQTSGALAFSNNQFTFGAAGTALSLNDVGNNIVCGNSFDGMSFAAPGPLGRYNCGNDAGSLVQTPNYSTIQWTGLLSNEYDVRCFGLTPNTVGAGIVLQYGEGGSGSFNGAISGTTLTVNSGTAPLLGSTITGTGVTTGTIVLSGSGSTYTVNNSQTVASETLTAALTWETSQYEYYATGYNSASASVSYASTSGAGLLFGNGAMNNSLSNGLNATVHLHNLSTSNTAKHMDGTQEYQSSVAAAFVSTVIGGVYSGDKNPITGIQIAATTGSLYSGSCELDYVR